MASAASLLLIAISLGAACAQVPASIPSSQRQVNLADLRDSYRPVLLFAPDETDPRLHQEMQLLTSHDADLRDRQVILLPMTLHSADPRHVWFPSGTGKGTLPEAEVLAARRRFGIAPDEFTVILLGKDGDEKLRVHQPVAWQRLRDLIDAMPMRQDEMRRQPHS